MVRILITGVNGFVGPYLIAACQARRWEVIGTEYSAEQTSESNLGVKFVSLDITNKEQVFSVVRDSAPDYVCHLAGFSSVRESWNKPELCRQINVEGTRNLLDAMKAHALNAKILIISSAEVYGRQQTSTQTENTPVAPENPYAKSREEQENLTKNYPDLHIVISRSFNHIGPEQPRGFVIPDFSAQIAAIEHGATPIIKTGNLRVRRDFTDVRDVVKAYCTLLLHGKHHTIYNVCSGQTHALQEMLDILLKMATVHDITVTEDPALIRPKETLELRGSREKITKETGWTPQIALDTTLKETLEYWRTQVSNEQKKI